MLRGRIAQRDASSVCAFCQYRLSLRRLAPPRHRLFSVTARCGAGDHDPTRPRSFRPFPLTQNLSTTATTATATATANPESRPLQSSSPPLGPSPPVTPASRFTFARRTQDDILDPYEAKARERLLARQAAQEAAQQAARQRPTQTPLPQPPAPRPRVNARYVWDPERQQAVEKYLKTEAIGGSRYGDVGNLTPPPDISRSDVRSGFSIRSQRTSPAGPYPGRTVPEVPLRRAVPSGGLTSGGAPGTRGAPGSGLTSSNDLATRGAPSSASTGSVASGFPGLSGPGGLLRPAPRPAPDPAPSDFGASLTGFAALEVAGLRDAAVKDVSNNGLGGLGGLGRSAEWGQLARKPTRTANMDDAFWTNVQDSLSRPQLKRADGQDTKRTEPDPRAIPNRGPTFDNFITPSPPRESATNQAASSDSWAITKPNTKPNTIANNEITSSPPQDRARDQGVSRERHDDYGNDREISQQRKPFERDQRPDKRRGGKRSQRGSQFEEEEGADGDNAWDRYMEKRRQKELRKAQRDAERTEPIPIILPELISITSFAKTLKIKPEDFLEQLGALGFEGVTLDSLMAGETAALVAQEYGYEPTVLAGESQDLKPRPPPEDPSTLPLRPPVVTIMGHVDHGKTTILDYLRQSSVAAQEHGGITQHIGAFSVSLSSGKPITFLDTPGHAAFLTMRQRGANVTDIVVLVVAADDSVKPQTLEALNHARAAKVPIIVAINKIDKDGARVDAVKHDLAQAGVEIEDFGGDVQVVSVSGKTGQGMEDLEESILTLSEILDHRSEVDGPAEGWILESSLKPTGKVATVLIKRGTLRPGDFIAAGLTWAKIRQLRNEAGVDVEEAPPGTPVEITGWKDLPAAGDQVIQSPDEDRAKTATSYREGLREREKDATEYEIIAEARKLLQEKRAREKETGESSTSGTTNNGTGVQEVLPDEEDGTKIVNFIVKGDVHGSVEAVCAAIQEIGSNEVRPRVLRSAAGPISEFDVEHAAISRSVIVNFATITPAHVQRMAEAQGVRILDHTVIYHLIDAIKANLSEYLAPAVTTRVLGEAEVLQIFPINTHKRFYKNIAGCRVRNGIVARNHLYRVLRKGQVVFDGKLETLKHVKKDVMEMRKGTECGMGFEEFQDMEVGDQIQAYEEVRTSRSF
ncbi:hypothetical protein F5X97DRAFT_313428 [Nemania serpens]|nr:hypothetical protein F5X97DRAFT_313428 [Nemania serpens]